MTDSSMTPPKLAGLVPVALLCTGMALAQGDDEQLGEVHFPVSCSEEAANDFESGVAQLHHMMYDQAQDHFEAAAEADPDCAMAHWGLAMSSFQPLWHPTSDDDLEQGKAAIERAQEISAPTEREQGYIEAAAAFFEDPRPAADTRAKDHELRLQAWQQAQQALHEQHPEDADAAAFSALAQVSYAMSQFSPEEEQDYALQRQAGALLERYLEDHPEHPGLHHYLIHAYDSPELADEAEAVAERYDQLAPGTPHALHMPSHIFVRLGQWQETAEWNERSAEAALRHPVNGETSLHYPHALDYMMYAYLQMGDEEKARETLDRVEAIEDVQADLAAAYGIAAPQARYYLERQKWEEAAELEPGSPDVLPWEDFPAAEAIFHFARGIGSARSGDLDQAADERDRITELVTALREEGEDYWASMTEALAMAVDAWTRYERGETEQAIALMREAAELEHSMDKHPVTPGEVLPVSELLGELLLREDRPQEAVAAFERSLERTPERRNALESIELASR